MGPLFHLQTLEDFFIRLSLTKTQWSHCCNEHWTDHCCKDTSTSDPYTTPRTGFSRSPFILCIHFCLFVLPIELQRCLLYEAAEICRQQLGPHGFYNDSHCVPVFQRETQGPPLRCDSWSMGKAAPWVCRFFFQSPGSRDIPRLEAEIPYSGASPTPHFEEVYSVHKAALELWTLTMSQVNCQETK